MVEREVAVGRSRVSQAKALSRKLTPLSFSLTKEGGEKGEKEVLYSGIVRYSAVPRDVGWEV